MGGHNPSSRKNIENLSRIKKQKMSLEQKMKNVKVSSVWLDWSKIKKMPSRGLELWLVIYQNQFFLYITILQKLRHQSSSVVKKVPQGDALTLLTWVQILAAAYGVGVGKSICEVTREISEWFGKIVDKKLQFKFIGKLIAFGAEHVHQKLIYFIQH